MNIRPARISDAPQITEIYNYYILNTHHTFETDLIDSAETQKRIEETPENYPFLVCEAENEILGYAYATQYKSRCAYKNSAEISVYVKNELRHKAVGKTLYGKLFEELSKTDVHAIIAGIALPNDASVRLHEKFGFEKVAHFREVGFKLNRRIDVGYWELINKK